MPILSLSEFTLQNNDTSILENAPISISNSEKIVLLGRNGSGKTTLMNYISNMSNVPVGYAKQDQSDLRGSVAEYLLKTEDWWEVPDILHKVFGFELNDAMKFEDLSGGEKMKILISEALKSSNHLILLDEPTNHLDQVSSQNLTQYIASDKRAYLIVSHDINFINSISNKIINIEDKKLVTYGGNYDFYKEQKNLFEQRKQARFETSQKTLKKLEAEMKQRRADSNSRKAKMQKKIKSGNSGIPKILASGLINKGEGIIAKELNLLKNRRNVAQETSDENIVTKQRKILFKLQDNKRRGSFVNFIDCTLNVNDRKLLENFNLQIESEDKILITGQNGSGKSVLARNLYFNQKSNISGEVIYGSEYTTFLLDQNLKLLDKSLSPLENFQSIVKSVSQDEIYKYLFSLNFNLENIKIPVENLSGGEKLKLIFAIINASQFDLLILDEPNNNLDIDSKEVLISILNEYKGAFVLISHDKSFYSSIETNKEYEINNNRMTRK